MWRDFNFFRETDRLTDKTDCLTPLRACARGVKIKTVDSAHTYIVAKCHQALFHASDAWAWIQGFLSRSCPLAMNLVPLAVSGYWKSSIA